MPYPLRLCRAYGSPVYAGMNDTFARKPFGERIRADTAELKITLFRRQFLL